MKAALQFQIRVSSAVVEHTPNTLIYEFLADEEENGTISNQPSEEATDFK